SIVAAGMVVASVVTAERAVASKTPPPQGMQWIEDSSLRVPALYAGATVTLASVHSAKELGREAPPGVAALITVQLEARRSLEIGDVLLIGQAPVAYAGPAATPLPEDADLAISSQTGALLGLLPGDS